MSDLTDQVDNLQDSIDDHESRVSDTESALSEQDGRITDVEQANADNQALIGQLDFPLNEDSIARIKEVFPSGVVTLSGGRATVTDARIGVNSVILYSIRTFAVLGATYGLALSDGSVEFQSSNAGDSSVLTYVIF
jgi:hypothetical protein